MDSLLNKLDELIEQRRHAKPDSSYVAALHDQGLNKILEKVGEEATETILAAKDAGPGNTEQVVHETADLLFHILVMLNHLGLSHDEVLKELDRRFGTSGITEKASRHSV